MKVKGKSIGKGNCKGKCAEVGKNLVCLKDSKKFSVTRVASEMR